MRYSSQLLILNLILVVILGAAVFGQNIGGEKWPGKVMFKTEPGLISMPVTYEALLFDLGVFADSIKRTEPWRFMGEMRIRGFLVRTAPDYQLRLTEKKQMEGVAVRSPELLKVMKDLNVHALVKGFPGFQPKDTLFWDSTAQKWIPQQDLSNYFEVHFQSDLPLDSAVAALKRIRGVLLASTISKFGAD